MSSDNSFIAIGYRYFLAVAETGSVRAASRSLNVAASAISRQLSLLEKTLGLAVFERGGRSLKLSEAGQVLVHSLQLANVSHEETLEHLNALRGLKAGRIRIATVESISVELLPRLLLDFAKAYPGIKTTMTVAGSEVVMAMVRAHEVDIGFTFNPASLAGIEVVENREFRICAVMAPSHKLAKANQVSLAECQQFAVAWPARGLSLRSILDRAMGPQKFEPTIECNSLRLMSLLAKRGNYIAFQTHIGIEQDLAAKKLVLVPITDKRLALNRLVVVRRAGRTPRPVVDAFIAMLAKQFLNTSTVRK